MRHKEIGQPEALLQVQQQVDDAGLNRYVERRYRLVEREDFRLQCQRPRDTDPLFLPAGKLGGIAAGVAVVQPDDSQQLGDACLASRPVKPVGDQRFSDDVVHRKPGIQRRYRVLKHHLQFGPQLATGGGIEGCDVGA